MANENHGRENVIVTGGGPGVMEAGNLGAFESGWRVDRSEHCACLTSRRQTSYVTPDLAFNFHYFAIRKMHFLMRAAAVAMFPGGFGTLDEMFESLTLIQTGRMKPVPFLLFGSDFWKKIIDWDALVRRWYNFSQ